MTNLRTENQIVRNVAMAHRIGHQIPPINRSISENLPKKNIDPDATAGQVLRRRHRFEHFEGAQFSHAARLFAQVGLTSWPAISKLGEESRKFLRGDLRKVRKCSARELSLPSIFPPFTRAKSRAEHRLRAAANLLLEN